MTTDPASVRLPVNQQPYWPDEDRLRHVLAELATAPPLVTPPACDQLRGRLSEVAQGRALLVQGGPCAETFGESQVAVLDDLATLHRMSTVLSEGTGLPVVTVGRMAGQFAKPRSKAVEARSGVVLPVYRGDAINAREFTAEARQSDPSRLRQAYEASARVLDFVRASPGETFTSHEGLLLDYERALTRSGPDGNAYATSGHLLWIGERTRHLGGPHVEYFAGIHNPVQVKLGPGTAVDEVLEYVERLNPNRESGRLTFVTRLGADRVGDKLPALVDAVIRAEAQVAWVCDPMHGNTVEDPHGRKTRWLDRMLAELADFVAVLRTAGAIPGGMHVEMTGAEVTECVGGGVTIRDLPRRYETACDPRLNRDQSLEFAAVAAELFAQPSSPVDQTSSPATAAY